MDNPDTVPLLGAAEACAGLPDREGGATTPDAYPPTIADVGS